MQQLLQNKKINYKMRPYFSINPSYVKGQTRWIKEL